MFYSDGHEANMTNGYAYNFAAGPEYFHADGSGQRATLRKFQTYPKNSVQGGGTLVMGVWMNGLHLPGSAFKESQPAQLIQIYEPIDSDLISGGVEYNGFGWQPLVEGNQ